MFDKEKELYLNSNGFETFRPKAVLFDMDGVLYDSMPNHACSWHKAMETFGIEMSETDAYKYEGMRGIETIRLLVKEQKGIDISEREAHEMYDEKARIFSKRPAAAIMDGVMELQDEIRRRGMKIGVVTGSGQKTLLEKLTKDFAGLVMPDMIVSSFDVTRGKPDPQPYIKGLEKTGAHPWEAIVVENAPLGVLAAARAKIFTVAVNTGPLPDSMLAESGANLIFKDMRSLLGSFGGIVE